MNSPMRRSVLGLILCGGPLMLSAGCAVEGGTGDHRPEVRHEDGGTWSRDAAWQVVERARIGTLEGIGPQVLGEIGALAVGPEGRVYVFDRMASEVRSFSLDGASEWVFGGPGPGPGEFRNVSGMAVAPDGQLWIVDPANRRYTLLDRERNVVTIPREANGGGRLFGAFSPSGSLLDAATAPDAEHPSYRLLEIDGAGAVQAEHLFPSTRIPLPTLGMGVMVPLPHAPRFLRALDGEGAVWHATTTEYRIARIAFTGDTTLVSIGRAQPSPLDLDEREAVAEGVRAARERFSVQIDDDMVPTSIGPLQWMVVDDGGNLWVCATGRDPCDRLDVIDASGVLLGTVQLPGPVDGDPSPVIRGDHFVAATTGPAGEPQVLIAVVRRPTGR